MAVFGEWDGELATSHHTLHPGVIEEVGPFSSISSFQIDLDSYTHYFGDISISIIHNDFRDPVLNYKREDVNRFPDTPLRLRKEDYCNLFFPTEYTLYVIGWIYKDDFLHACRKYDAWVWPKDSVNRHRNQAWTQISVADGKKLTKAGFSDIFPIASNVLRVGWLKNVRGLQGACCYVFPNIGYGGGVKETNLYILPQDLYTMKTLHRDGRMP